MSCPCSQCTDVTGGPCPTWKEHLDRYDFFVWPAPPKWSFNGLQWLELLAARREPSVANCLSQRRLLWVVAAATWRCFWSLTGWHFARYKLQMSQANEQFEIHRVINWKARGAITVSRSDLLYNTGHKTTARSSFIQPGNLCPSRSESVRKTLCLD